MLAAVLAIGASSLMFALEPPVSMIKVNNFLFDLVLFSKTVIGFGAFSFP